MKNASKIIFKSTYYRASKHKKLGDFVNYISRRDGVDTSINEGFISYLDARPKSHGLFSSEDNIDLEKTKSEVANHKGVIYTHIVSLRREDAERLELASAAAWKSLIMSKQIEIANSHKIPIGSLKWCAAFHNEAHHPHIHLMVWNENPSQEYLTKQGIAVMRESLAREIFRGELFQLYSDKTEVRNSLKAEFKDVLSKINFKENPELENLLRELSKELKKIDGKKQYGYLKKPLKKQVDEIVKIISADENISSLYDRWCELQREIIGTYSNKERTLSPLWEQKEFRSIKNSVIYAAINLDKEPMQANMTTAALAVLMDLARLIETDYDKKIARAQRNLDRKARQKELKKKLAMGQKMG
jgi:hypothetical protein